MERAYKDGYAAGYAGRTWLDCGYSGRLREKWLDGFDAGRNSRAAGSPSTMADWRHSHPNPVHGCGHMQGRGAA